MPTLMEKISLETLVKAMREQIDIEMDYAVDELVEEEGARLVKELRRRIRLKVGELSMELAKTIQIEKNQNGLTLTVTFKEPDDVPGP